MPELFMPVISFSFELYSRFCYFQNKKTEITLFVKGYFIFNQDISISYLS